MNKKKKNHVVIITDIEGLRTDEFHSNDEKRKMTRERKSILN